MAGAYCRYCDHRCFVYRQVWVGGHLIFGGHLATCERGKEHDRASLGRDCDMAYNPADPEAVPPPGCAPRR